MTYGIQRIEDLDVAGLSEYTFEEKDGYRVLHGQLSGNGGSTVVSLQYKDRCRVFADNLTCLADA
jgi:hypothetical protein